MPDLNNADLSQLRREHESPNETSIKDWSDRELLEYIALNALTPDTIVAAMQREIPGLVQKLRDLMEDHPELKGILRFVPVPKWDK